MPKPNNIKELLSMADAQGWTVTTTAKSGYRFTPPEPDKPQVTVSFTAENDFHTWQNALSRMHQSGMVWDPQKQGEDVRIQEYAEMEPRELAEAVVALESMIEEVADQFGKYRNFNNDRFEAMSRRQADIERIQGELDTKFVKVKDEINGYIDSKLRGLLAAVEQARRTADPLGNIRRKLSGERDQ
jgi:hypothetical protein